MVGDVAEFTEWLSHLRECYPLVKIVVVDIGVWRVVSNWYYIPGSSIMDILLSFRILLLCLNTLGVYLNTG